MATSKVSTRPFLKRTSATFQAWARAVVSTCILAGVVALGVACSGEGDQMVYRQPPLFVSPHLSNPHVPNSAPWVNSPQWGQNVVLQNLFVGAQPNLSVAREIMKLSNSGRPPQTMTVHTGLFNDVFDGEEYALVGVLRYGSGGGIQEVEFDWLNGCELSVVADSVMVLVKIEGIYGAAPVVPANVSVSALVGFGNRPGSFGPQRTFTVGVASTAHTFIDIPDKARRVLIYDASHIYSNLVTFATQSGGATSIVTFDWSQLRDAVSAGQGFAIPAGSQRVIINNQSLLSIDVAVVFQLDL